MGKHMTNFERGFMDKLAQAAAEQAMDGPDLPAYANRAQYTGGQNAKTLYTNLARNAQLCSSMFNVANGKAKNVRSPKPLPVDQQPQPQQAEAK